MAGCLQCPPDPQWGLPGSLVVTVGVGTHGASTGKVQYYGDLEKGPLTRGFRGRHLVLES